MNIARWLMLLLIINIMHTDRNISGYQNNFTDWDRIVPVHICREPSCFRIKQAFHFIFQEFSNYFWDMGCGGANSGLRSAWSFVGGTWRGKGLSSRDNARVPTPPKAFILSRRSDLCTLESSCNYRRSLGSAWRLETLVIRTIGLLQFCLRYKTIHFKMEFKPQQNP